MNYSFPRYLAAKKTIDDRALNQHVWDTMTRAVSPAAPGEPLRILEVGCGIGTMFERLSERGFPIPFTYTGIDASPENITSARVRFLPTTDHSPLTPYFLLADLFALPPEILPASFDLLLAHAVLDLLDLSRALPHLFRYLRPGGVFYFTLNFDGETIFQPEHPLDPLILALYHRTMDERLTEGVPSGDSRTGRHLFAHLQNSGAEILAAGSSDWVVFPGAMGYPGDEAYFLHHILHFFEQSLSGYSELPENQLLAWLETRHGQITRKELVFLAHQLDFAGTVQQFGIS
ncbi:MAG: class I SAM-dependent methyltransferase [Anaerolineales bacterium]|nr:class I SAM-dependent methyltransferase [Anaerolineales bacterium]